MKWLNETTAPDDFRTCIETAGFPNDPGKTGRFAGTIRMSDEYIAESGGLLRAVSRKSAEILRKDLQGLEIRDLSEYTDRWKLILMHMHPHLDEYLASLLLRSCLPDSMHTLRQGETALYSRDDDAEAKRTWPSAALLGLGNTVNGGAQAMLVFDEHESAGQQKESSSLVMLMKRFLLGTQRPPDALYMMLREVNHIDQYGELHPKGLSAYAKYLQTVPLPSAGNACMSPEWKCAVMDACLTAFYLWLKSPAQRNRSRSVWEPALKLSLEDFAARTPLRGQADFGAIFTKIRTFLTDRFAVKAARGELKYSIPSPKNPAKTSEAEINLLIPYLPAIMFNCWGGTIGQALLYPLWECRVNREILTEQCYRELCRKLPAKPGSPAEIAISAGQIRVVWCDAEGEEEKPIRIFDFTPAGGLSAPTPLNQYIQNNAGGRALGIFRNGQTGTILLTKGGRIDPVLWERICARLTDEEGESDDPERCGAWHVTRNPLGLAPFLLNGNATHRYIAQSRITADSLAAIVNECRKHNADD